MASLIDRSRARALVERAFGRTFASAEIPHTRPGAPGPAPEGESPDAQEPGLAPDPETAAEPEATAEPGRDPWGAPNPESFIRQLQPRDLALESAPTTNALYERLSREDVAEIEQRIGESAELRELSESYAHSASERVRRHLVLSFGVYLGIPAALAKTGLLPAEPPADVHAMSRGPLAAAGGLYEADLVVDALSSAGADIAKMDRALDFGCSSARVVRVLAAAYPEIAWQGCDPNAGAIVWASGNLPRLDLFVNRDAPPLPLSAASLDLVYAISIWSHFEPTLGMRWFNEMHRVIRPDGHLVCTTHGLTSVAFYASNGLRSLEQSQEIAKSLYHQGWWFAQEFGEEGDWGVLNPAWGTAFLSPEWMLAELCPRWRVLEFAPGRNQYNQDVYVLQRA